MRGVEGEGGIGGTVGDGQLVIDPGLVDGLRGGLQIGAGIHRQVAKLVQRHDPVGEVEGAGDVELVHRRALVQQLQQLDLGGAQVDLRRLVVGFVLHALQLQALQVQLGDIAGGQAIAGDGQFAVEVVQVVLGQRQNGLGLQGGDEGAPQSEDQRADEVGLLRDVDGGSFLGAVAAQFAFVIALAQIVQRNHGESIGKRPVGVAVEGLELVDAE